MAYAESNGHVTDDVKWTWKVKLLTPICLEPNISKTAGPPIENGLWEIEWGNRMVTWPMTNTFRAKYLANSWIYYWATIRNY